MTRFSVASELHLGTEELLNASAATTIFQTLEWQSHWLKAFQTGPLKVLNVLEGNSIVGTYPLCCSKSLWKGLRAVGTGPSDYLFPLAIESALPTIRCGLDELAKTHLLDLHQIPSDHPFADTSGIEQARCLVLDLPQTFDEYVKGLSKSLRYDVRRINGKALSEKNAKVEWVTPDTVDRFADAFFDLHRLRWKSRGLPGAFFGKSERFQREWMHIAAEKGWLWMSLLIADGKPVGSVYAMRFQETCYFYQAGMDPSASSLSPGTILVAQTIQRAIEDGCTTFDFMRGDEPYKRRWKPTRERINYRILSTDSGVVGNVGLTWNHFAWRVECKIRDRVEGKSLIPKKQPKSDE